MDTWTHFSLSRSHAVLNAYAILPKGPNVEADLALPHNRADMYYLIYVRLLRDYQRYNLIRMKYLRFFHKINVKIL